jgi:Cdc6-like AAA superfamily ATPase
MTQERDKEARMNVAYEFSRLEHIMKDHSKDYVMFKIEDMFTKTKKDLARVGQLEFQLDEIIARHFRLLDRKLLSSSEELSEIEQRSQYIIEVLNDLTKEIQNIAEELESISSDRNPYTAYGFKLNPFSLTVPLEKPSTIINQQKPQETSKEFINGVMRGSDANVLLIVGDEGVGKSHFLNLFANQLNSGQFGKSLAVRIQSKIYKDVIDLYPQITEALKRILIERNELKLSKVISKVLTESGTPRLVEDFIKIFKQISRELDHKGYQSIFIFIDEFENSLPVVPEHQMHVASLGVPRAISQLGSLTKLSGVGFILTFRKDDWNKWQEKIKERVNKIEKKYTIAIEPLSLEDSKRFILHRLDAEEFKLPTDHPMAQPEFTQDTIESIWKRVNGNPRAMLRLANTLFRKAIRNETKLIEPIELLETR